VTVKSVPSVLPDMSVVLKKAKEPILCQPSGL